MLQGVPRDNNPFHCDLNNISADTAQDLFTPQPNPLEGRDQDSGSSFIMTEGEDIYLSGATNADQDFIAHARQDIVRLLAEVRRLRSSVK